MKQIQSILFLVFFIPLFAVAQKRNAIWCFGDSAGIDFTTPSNPFPISTAMDGRGSCVSISDTLGQLRFYAFNRAGFGNNTTLVISYNDSLMQNGTNIIGQGWYQELIIIPDPADDSMYYLFTCHVTNTPTPGLYYSTIDMRQDSGIGAVVQKNVQLLSYQITDGIQAVKHGNGRDWWVFCHRWDTLSNAYYRYLVDPFGIHGPYIQNIGDSSRNGWININFSKDGSKAAIINYWDLMELYNFDRCTGEFNNFMQIHHETINPPYYYIWRCDFSPNGNFLYVCTHDTDSYLLQFNLLDADPWATRDTIGQELNVPYSGGNVRRGPDDRVYYSQAWNSGTGSVYPYDSTEYNVYNMNLSVVTSPDSFGTACNYQPYSFYLGSKRTYLGLPNNPDYDMLALGGSICDTLSAPVNEIAISETANLHVFYHRGWMIVFINGEGLRGKNYSMHVFDLAGREIFNEVGFLTSSFFTKDLDFHNFAGGMYIIVLQTERERLTRKFIK